MAFLSEAVVSEVSAVELSKEEKQRKQERDQRLLNSLRKSITELIMGTLEFDVSLDGVQPMLEQVFKDVQIKYLEANLGHRLDHGLKDLLEELEKKEKS